MIKPALITGVLFILCGIIFCSSVAADSWFRPTSQETQLITVAVIIGVVALIGAFFFLASGVKYVTAENVLDTDVRKNLYHYIDECPGSHLREIARELDLKPSNAAWHLRKLEQTNLVRSRLIGGKKVYYLVEGGIESRKRAIAESILRNSNAYNIMQFLYDNPGKHLLEIAHALQLNHHVVKWHIKKMYLAELVEGDTTNSAYPVYYPTEIGAEALQNYLPSNRNRNKAA
ncbi:MAG: winged helix-turn-helix transcriptional regulator [Candidatus Thermoplasmatota archaeon]|nr:winged helix-turn-helix transcriptional regulator [Candidatus Thermoplasmatota archaeon]MBU1941719.1 winged helix-turn-helix transcriptional regulator [Candidatus Thermoplasmatota archaeon]